MSQYHALPHAVALNARISFFEVAPRKTNESLLTRLHTAFTVARTRRALAQMDARTLADIGLTEDQAAFEAARPIWDIKPQCMR